MTAKTEGDAPLSVATGNPDFCVMGLCGLNQGKALSEFHHLGAVLEGNFLLKQRL